MSTPRHTHSSHSHNTPTPTHSSHSPTRLPHILTAAQLSLLHLARGVAAGMSALHSRRPPLPHGDLRPENVLLAPDPAAPLGLRPVVSSPVAGACMNHGRGL